MKKLLWLLSAIGSVSLLSAAVVAQTPASAPATRTERTGGVRISIKGTTTYDKKQGLARLLGDVRVTQEGEDFILYANELIYNENRNEAIAKGSPRVESRDSTITGNEIRAYFDRKLIVVTGNVTIRSHGADDGIKGSDPNKKPGTLRDEVTGRASRMTCSRIDYNYSNREAVITGNIRMLQGKSTGTCERILFDEENNIAELTGRVQFTDGEGRTMRVEQLRIYIDADHVETQAPTRWEIPNKPKNTTPATDKTKFPAPTKLPGDLFSPEPTPLPTTRTSDTPTAKEAPATAPAGEGAGGETPRATEPVEGEKSDKGSKPGAVKTASRE